MTYEYDKMEKYHRSFELPGMYVCMIWCAQGIAHSKREENDVLGAQRDY